MIDAKQYAARVGHPPIEDDLERANCPDAGQVGHYFCGWCERCDRPRFLCFHSLICDGPNREDFQ
jgi:hypothetical protein